MQKTELAYQQGLGNHFESEALANVLQRGRNSPQKVAYGLYAEQLSGAAFTAPRHTNLHSWLYRMHPSVLHGEFTRRPQTFLTGAPATTEYTPPTQMRWDPLPMPNTKTNFIDGLVTLAGNGSIDMQTGAAIHLYACNDNMPECYFYNADGEFLIVPQQGTLRFKTEFGVLEVVPSEIAVIPRGVKFQVDLLDSEARGYICENFGTPFRLPELGLIGANGLAHARDFQIPTACYESRQGSFKLIAKFQGSLWQADLKHSPLDVVAWHGCYVPYKYDLNLFNPINTVRHDHPDPSIFTVLTSPSNTPGVANIDFVIFPPRWMVAEDTFRPPYFHRNVMSEYMGLITGTYDAKVNSFVPGGGSLHNCMSPHGPDAEAYHQAIERPLKPEYYDHTMAFMFESKQVWRVTPFAYESNFRQKSYLRCWEGLKSNFEGEKI